MTARTRILGASALAFFVLVVLAHRAAPSDCVPSSIFVLESVANNADLVIWGEDRADRAFEFLRAQGYEYSGAAVIVRPVDGGAIVSVVQPDGMICSGVIVGPSAWRQLREAVEGLPA